MATEEDTASNHVSNHAEDEDHEKEETSDPNTQRNKRQKKSFVSEHFTINTVSVGVRRACCKHCNQTFAYISDTNFSGTSHLERHITRGTCQEKPDLTVDTPLSKSGGNDSGSSHNILEPLKRQKWNSRWNSTVDADRARHEIAKMIIMHDYPLHMVEHPGFLTVLQTLQPHFNLSFDTVHRDCLMTYQMEKDKIMKSMESIPGRVCLALDMWVSSQSVGYVFVTSHFIDKDWKLQKRLLNVVMEPYPDSDTALSHAVASCLGDWGLENNLFSLTINQSLGETAIEALRSQLAIKNPRSQLAIKNPNFLGGQLLVGNCIARTFCAIALDILEEGKEMVRKVRDSVKYVKTSDSHEEKFTELKQRLQVPSERSLSIDDATQWNTTYHMLVAASELKDVFFCLDTSDPDYKGALLSDEWKQIETICSYLKLLFDAANILATITAATKPTQITFFHEVGRIQLELTKAAAAANGDSFSRSLAERVLMKVEQYWKSCSLVLATAVVMDPQFKMKLVKFIFKQIYGKDAHKFINIVEDGIRELFYKYKALPLPLMPTSGNLRSGENYDGTHSNYLTYFDKYVRESRSQSELDEYLKESLMPRVQDFDVLGWWKLNERAFPILSKMARDILSIPVSTVSSDSMFRTTVKEMDSYRSLLKPDVVQALICAKDWILSNALEDGALVSKG